MSFNGGTGIGAPGTKEVVRNTPEATRKTAKNGLWAAVLFGALGLLGILVAGWYAVAFVTIGGMLLFAFLAYRYAFKHKTHRWSTALGGTVALIFVVVMVVMYPELRALWPVPVIRVVEYPPTVVDRYTACGDLVCHNDVVLQRTTTLTACGDLLCDEGGYPLAGIEKGMASVVNGQVLEVRAGTLYANGAPTGPVSFYDDVEAVYIIASGVWIVRGQALYSQNGTLYINDVPSEPLEYSSGESVVLVEVDGDPLSVFGYPIEFAPEFVAVTKRTRGALALASVAVVVAIALGNTQALALVAASIAETVNPNMPATPQQAPWYAPVGFSMWTLFDRGLARQLRGAIVGGIVPDPPQTIIEEVTEVIYVSENDVEVLAVDKLSGDPTVVRSPDRNGHGNGVVIARIPLSHAKTPWIRELCAEMNAGALFSRSTGTRCGWSDGGWDIFRDWMIDKGYAKRANSQSYVLLPEGRKILRAYGLNKDADDPTS